MPKVVIDTDRFVTKSAFAEMKQVSIKTVSAWIKRGNVKVKKYPFAELVDMNSFSPPKQYNYNK